MRCASCLQSWSNTQGKYPREENENELGIDARFVKTTHVEGFLFRKVKSRPAYLIVSRLFFVRFSCVSGQRLFLFHQFIRFFRQGNLDDNCCSKSAVFCLFGLCVARLISATVRHELHASWKLDRFLEVARVTISCQRNGANSVVSSLKLPLFQGSPVQTVGNWGNHFLGRDSRVINSIERQMAMKEKDSKKMVSETAGGRGARKFHRYQGRSATETCEIP